MAKDESSKLHQSRTGAEETTSSSQRQPPHTHTSMQFHQNSLRVQVSSRHCLTIPRGRASDDTAISDSVVAPCFLIPRGQASQQAALCDPKGLSFTSKPCDCCNVGIGRVPLSGQRRPGYTRRHCEIGGCRDTVRSDPRRLRFKFLQLLNRRRWLCRLLRAHGRPFDCRICGGTVLCDPKRPSFTSGGVGRVSLSQQTN